MFECVTVCTTQISPEIDLSCNPRDFFSESHISKDVQSLIAQLSDQPTDINIQNLELTHNNLVLAVDKVSPNRMEIRIISKYILRYKIEGRDSFPRSLGDLVEIMEIVHDTVRVYDFYKNQMLWW